GHGGEQVRGDLLVGEPGGHVGQEDLVVRPEHGTDHSRPSIHSMIVPMSLSPRPDRLISTVRPASSSRAFATQATAWADSRAGMIPSVRASSATPSRASASVTET